ncbi:MAG: hypothetical protein JOS17DRAFT_141371 [Linnemannia elongata]|nr:MAG: hypothetical protein JOS17DRAFT_141371 [Linnemannia elongata]
MVVACTCIVILFVFSLLAFVQFSFSFIFHFSVFALLSLFSFCLGQQRPHTTTSSFRNSLHFTLFTHSQTDTTRTHLTSNPHFFFSFLFFNFFFSSFFSFLFSYAVANYE